MTLTVTNASGSSSATASITVATGWAATYYVSNAGSDTASGTSSASPWKTVAKVNSSAFSPGDQILFNCGGVWREQLNIPSSGSSAAPITFGAYGTGNAPIISGSNVATGWTLSSGSRLL